MSGLAAIGLAVVMTGAMVADILVLPNPPELPIVLFLACVAVAWAPLAQHQGPVADVQAELPYPPWMAAFGQAQQTANEVVATGI